MSQPPHEQSPGTHPDGPDSPDGHGLAPEQAPDTVARRVEPRPDGTTDPADVPTGATDLSDVSGVALALNWSALSDVGRVRRDNQDSGYAGAHLLAVCDGVGGAARGDIASSTAVQTLRRLDEPSDADPLERVAGALQRAHDRIGEIADADESLSGTSTTATVALFDGRALTVGHVGDSRAYLLRGGHLRQLTHDHTFVQSLVDEGRITEDEARVHPHRNLILKAVDGVRDPEPDLFTVDLAAGDRLFLCSDGACGVLDDVALAAILSTGTPDYAAVELVRESLEAGSTDNVTCVVADVVTADAELPEDLTPLLVGAAADLPRLSGAAGVDETSTRISAVAGPGAASPTSATSPTSTPDAAASTTSPGEPEDEEVARYAPREPQRFDWLRRIFITIAFAGLVWVALVAAWSWSQKQFFVGEHDGAVTIFRGIDASFPGVDLNHPYETSDVLLEDLAEYDASVVRDGISATDLAKARETVDNLATKRVSG